MARPESKDRAFRGLAALALAVSCALACSGPAADDPSDAGADAGLDGGLDPDAGPAELPLVRMADALAGTSHVMTYQGVVDSHGPAREIPPEFGELVPARQLTVRDVGGGTKTLYYTLPVPLAFAAFPNDQVRVLYRELAGADGSSFGLRVDTVTNDLRVLVEDGSLGPALSDEERLGFSFTLDLGQPLGTETLACARRVHYPVVVKNGAKSRRLFHSQSEPYTLASGQEVTFSLVDAYRLEDSLCGAAPDFSIGYVVVPRR